MDSYNNKNSWEFLSTMEESDYITFTSFMDSGSKINAIKFIHDKYGLSLSSAKDICEQYLKID